MGYAPGCNWLQGLSFFLPDEVWLQPPGYVHRIISNLTWLPQAIVVSLLQSQQRDSVWVGGPATGCHRGVLGNVPTLHPALCTLHTAWLLSMGSA